MRKQLFLFRTDETYLKEVSHYKKADGVLALTVFVILMAVYYLAGQLRDLPFDAGIPVNLFFIALCVMLALLRRQGIGSLGLKRKNAGKSFFLGLVPGLLILLFYILQGLVNRRVFAPAGTISGNFFYYLIVIAFMEELVFRGYIQSRMFGLIKNNALSTAVTGVMFVLMHFPYQLGARDMDLITFISDNVFWFGLLFLYHLLFTWLFRKHNLIIAPVIVHTMMNWGSYLFIA